MDAFVATVLICMNTVPQADCTTETAADVLPKRVANELGCWTGWQEIVARSALAQDVGTTAYVRMTCRRIRDGGDPDAPRGGINPGTGLLPRAGRDGAPGATDRPGE